MPSPAGVTVGIRAEGRRRHPLLAAEGLGWALRQASAVLLGLASQEGPCRKCPEAEPQLLPQRLGFSRTGMGSKIYIIRAVSEYTCHQAKPGEIVSERTISPRESQPEAGNGNIGESLSILFTETLCCLELWGESWWKEGCVATGVYQGGEGISRRVESIQECEV